MPHGMFINNVMSSNMELKNFNKEEFIGFLEKNYKSAVGKVKLAMCFNKEDITTVFLYTTGALRYDPLYICRKLMKEYNISHVYLDGKCFTRKWFEDKNWELK